MLDRPARRRRLPQPAMVIALLALFISLGGTSYAVATITGASVKNGSLTGADVRTGSLTGKQIRNRSLMGIDIKARSLLASNFAAGQLPAGAQGPAGPAGTPADTSKFNTKTEADAKYLAAAGTAANATQLGGVAAASYAKTSESDLDYLNVHGEGGEIRSTTLGTTSTVYDGVFDVGALGELQIQCAVGGASGTLRFHNSSGFALLVTRQDGGVVTRDSVANGADSGTIAFSSAAIEHNAMLVASNAVGHDENADLSLWNSASTYCALNVTLTLTHTG